MLLSSKNDESGGNKTFEVYFSYITAASNIFKQKKTLIDKVFVLWFIVEKVCLFEIRYFFSNFLRASSTRLD